MVHMQINNLLDTRLRGYDIFSIHYFHVYLQF
jgi:hypothetical protein